MKQHQGKTVSHPVLLGVGINVESSPSGSNNVVVPEIFPNDICGIWCLVISWGVYILAQHGHNMIDRRRSLLDKNYSPDNMIDMLGDHINTPDDLNIIKS